MLEMGVAGDLVARHVGYVVVLGMVQYPGHLLNTVGVQYQTSESQGEWAASRLIAAGHKEEVRVRPGSQQGRAVRGVATRAVQMAKWPYRKAGSLTTQTCWTKRADSWD